MRSRRNTGEYRRAGVYWRPGLPAALRHAAIARLLGAGATEHEVMSVTGLSRQTVDTYALGGRQDSLAESAIAQLPKSDD